jgi:hypothetical protein
MLDQPLAAVVETGEKALPDCLGDLRSDGAAVEAMPADSREQFRGIANGEEAVECDSTSNSSATPDRGGETTKTGLCSRSMGSLSPATKPRQRMAAAFNPHSQSFAASASTGRDSTVAAGEM